MKKIPFFNRECIVEVYNENNKKGCTYYGRSHTRNTENDFIGARIEFLVQKTLEKNNLPTAVIKIYGVKNVNNKEELKTQALQKNAFIRLFAGYSADFDNDNWTPIFEGNIITATPIHQPPENYIMLYCVACSSVRAKRLPSVSLQGKITMENILSSMNGKIQDIGYAIDTLSLKNIYDGYSTNIISNRGFSTNGTTNISGFLDNITSSISTTDNKFTWFVDDISKKIKFSNLILYNKNNSKKNTQFTLIRGVNAKLVDNSSVERNNRELYYKSAIQNNGKLAATQKKQGQIGRQTGGYKDSIIISSPIVQGLNLSTKYNFKNFDNLPPNISINTMRWIGDTHSQGDNWKIEYIFSYERRN